MQRARVKRREPILGPNWKPFAFQLVVGLGVCLFASATLPLWWPYFRPVAIPAFALLFLAVAVTVIRDRRRR